MVVVANITDPATSDSAIIMINSIEKGTYSPEEINTKIAFTRDLLSMNPQCLELIELLLRAEEAVKREDIDEASELLSVVLENCRYLIAEVRVVSERMDFFDSLYSRVFRSTPSRMTRRYFLITLAVFSLILLSLLFERFRLWERFKRQKKKFKKRKKPRMQSV